MNNDKLQTPMIFLSVFIFGVFAYTSFVNIFINKSSDSYLSTENSMINADIKNMEYNKGRLVVTISGQAIKGCIKSTKTTPDNNSNCWINIENNQFSTSVLKSKTYYIWLMDEFGTISNKYDYHWK